MRKWHTLVFTYIDHAFLYRTSFLYELAPSITIRTLALVTADFHSHNQIFPVNRKAEQAERAETIFIKWS